VSVLPADFLQALVFCNSQPDAQALADQLCGLGYPAAFVSGSHAQVRAEAPCLTASFQH
jgi:superfamily II DNA/RNA helicase